MVKHLGCTVHFCSHHKNISKLIYVYHGRLYYPSIPILHKSYALPLVLVRCSIMCHEIKELSVLTVSVTEGMLATNIDTTTAVTTSFFKSSDKRLE